MFFGGGFREQAARHASRPALSGAGIAWTYGQLDEAYDRAAATLAAALGGQPATHVALLFEHAPTAVVAILAVLKTGGVCVPLNPGHPAAWHRHILGESEARLVLTDSPSEAFLRGLGLAAPILNLHTAPPAGSGAPPAPDVPDALAMILYTSGSTGLPKGVMRTHRSLAHDAAVAAAAADLTPEDRVTLLAPLCYSGAAGNLLGALLRGASAAFYSVPRDGLAPLGEWMARDGISVYHSMPALFRQFARELGPGRRLPRCAACASAANRPAARTRSSSARCSRTPRRLSTPSA